MRFNVCPIEKEIRRVVFELNGDNSSGLDYFTRLFYHLCWEIVGKDIVKDVVAFF